MLIDINTAAITHRNGVLSGITDRNYAKTIRHLRCYNAALPKEYQIIIDTELYNEKVKENTVAVCCHCSEHTDQKDIEIISILLDSVERLLQGRKYENVWICPKCKKDNRQAETAFIRSVRQQPYYLRVVPESPTKNIGIAARITFDPEFEAWASNFLEELEQAAAKFRQEYRPKDHSEIDENMLDLSMEGTDN